MIVDSSTLVAILTGEPERDRFVETVRDNPGARVSAANYLETGVVVDRVSDPVLSRRLDELLDALDVTIADVTAEHARLARSAYRDYGRGSGHPAKLNFGDCFAYALAVSAGEPLLYKGDDFVHTDVRAAC